MNGTPSGTLPCPTSVLSDAAVHVIRLAHVDAPIVESQDIDPPCGRVWVCLCMKAVSENLSGRGRVVNWSFFAPFGLVEGCTLLGVERAGAKCACVALLLVTGDALTINTICRVALRLFVSFSTTPGTEHAFRVTLRGPVSRSFAVRAPHHGFKNDQRTNPRCTRNCGCPLGDDVEADTAPVRSQSTVTGAGAHVPCSWSLRTRQRGR